MADAQPQILAPAGDRDSFLAALAAGADAVYVGLKHFSARMQASNFDLAELAALGELARARGTATYVAMNTLVKPDEVSSAGRLLDRLSALARRGAVGGLIFQDLAFAELARQTGFPGELHLSTLAAVSEPGSLPWIKDSLGVHRVVLPRELDIDEIKACADACPPDLSLEVFVHGALCYAVSGRCYWSSYLGGKSGLRGRCLQPCRRHYGHRKRSGRYFSCQDLRLESLAKLLAEVPQVSAWKIEGRKKGPHYVFHAVSAYRLLRDENFSPEAKKQAAAYLDAALGRPGTRYRFLPQRPFVPVDVAGETGSGTLACRVGKPGENKAVSIKPRFPLKRGDLLRVGSEDEPWHRTVRVTKDVPKGGRFDLPPPGPAKDPKKRIRKPEPGTPVFLIDRREPELAKLLGTMARKLESLPPAPRVSTVFEPVLPKPAALPSPQEARSLDVQLFRRLPTGRVQGQMALWARTGPMREVNRTLVSRLWWWLPPVIWPDEEADWQRTAQRLLKGGAKRFVLGAVWQKALLQDAPHKLTVWAGPFCNLSNALALGELARLGFAGGFLSPELSKEDALALARQSPVRTGVVLSGLWPLCVARSLADEVKVGEPLSSPMGEPAFARRHGPNVWLYPGWPMDLTPWRQELERAGTSMFVQLRETLPPKAAAKRSASTFNWNLSLT